MLKIGILSGSKLAVPSIAFLLQNGIALEIVLPDRDNEDQAELEHHLIQFGLPYQRWKKKQVNQQLASWSLSAQLNYIWVLTFPYIINEETLKYLSVPICNFHFAPLPKYRGAQPVFWMIKNLEKEGGIAIHELTKEIDAGPIHHFEPYIIKAQETFGSYMQNISQLNIQAIDRFLPQLLQSKEKHPIEIQKEDSSNYFTKPDSFDVRINWENMTAVQIEALCRACNPWNRGAMTTLEGKLVRIIEVEIHKELNQAKAKPGSIVLKKNVNRFFVSTSDSKYLELRVIATEEGIYGAERMMNALPHSDALFQ